jgi:hypothetical protein
MKGSCIAGICLTGGATETLGLEQSPRLEMRDRRGKRAIRRIAGAHADISRIAAASVTRPRASKAEVDFAGAAINPHWLVTRQRACRAITGIAGYVGSWMIDETPAKLVHGTAVWDRHHIVVIVVALSHLMTVG